MQTKTHFVTMLVLFIMAGFIAAACVIPKVLFGISIPVMIYWLTYTCVADALEDKE